ncbi:site-specific integrase [Actinomycetospora sp. NBRC 106378]|uniref:tyrosine-type recombinase/integrase n=1 Tax=Actinomycetospora sp. NBRC 106378 TaxID=3032208 RepID=UPI00249FD4AC|nr:site-specific integrase [Actinomycetospora sp. NBRC 106378]GLZ54997.1 hypothetical protein Acsp07_46140 [Actinomycetospora sp. NBRC 106378]
MGHVQDRWFRTVRDEFTGETRRERTDLHGTGLRYKVRYVDPEGRERSKSFPDRRKKAAEDFLGEMESGVRAGTYLDPNAGKMPFREYAESWVKGQSSDASSRQSIESRLRSQLYPFFDRRPVDAIGPARVRDWLARLEEQRLDGTYRAVLFDTLSSIMNAAVEDKLIRDNPCQARSIKKPRRSSRRVVPWSVERVRAVREGLAERWRLAVDVGAGLGLRQGEVLGLSPDDLDTTEAVVHVVRQLRIIRGQLVFAPPKGGKSRTVPLPDEVRGAVAAHRRSFPSVRVRLPWLEPGGRTVEVELLLSNERGAPHSGDHFNKVKWRGAFRTAGLAYEPRTDGMHALRHFYASTLLAGGVSIKEVAEYLGHTDPGFTLRTYTHLVPSSHARARQAVDAVLRAGVDTSDGLRTA